MRIKIFNRKFIACVSMIMAFAAILSATVLPLSASAAPFGRSAYRGYFTNNSDPNWSGTDLIYMSDINNTTSFINRIKSSLNAGGKARTSAAFIVFTMLGHKTWDATGRALTVGNGYYTQWENLVKQYSSAGRINYGASVSYNYNTYYDPDTNDVAWYNNSSSSVSIVFKNANGDIIYRIKKDCGNPVGALNGLPAITNPNNFSVDAQSYIKAQNTDGQTSDSNWKQGTITVHPGQFLYFKHQIKQVGGNTSTIRYYWVMTTSGSSEWGSRTTQSIQGRTTAGNPNQVILRKANMSSPGNLPSDVGTSYSWYKNEDSGGMRGVSYADIGKTICQGQEYNLQSTVSGGTNTGNVKNTPQVCAKVEPWPWQLSLGTEIKSDSTNTSYTNKDINVKVGETVNWKHTAANNSGYTAPGRSDASGYSTIGYNLLYGQTTKPTNGVASPETHWVRDSTAGTVGDIKSGDSYSYEASKSSYHGLAGISGMYSFNNDNKPPTQYKVQSTDVGKRVCQRAYVGRSVHGGTESWGEWRCAYVAYDYELTPCISSGTVTCGGTSVPGEPGETIPLVPTVKNPGGTPTKKTDWKITTFEVDDEGIPTPANGVDNSSGDTCGTYNSIGQFNGGTSNCSTPFTNDNSPGKDTFNDASTTFTDLLSSFTIPSNAPLGKRYCFALSVSPFKMSETDDSDQQDRNQDWRHSAAICIIVTKKPKMQVWGGNVYTGSGIQTSVSTLNGQTFGSWVEYAGLSGGTITGFTSGASTSKKPLTFSNKATAGNYGTKKTDADLSNKLTTRYDTFSNPNSNMQCVNSSADDSVQICKSTAGTTAVPTSAFNAGNPKNTVILTAGNANQTVYITENLINRSVINNINDSQQFIIIAKNIYIAPNVTEINAWLLAEDTVVTCAKPNGATLAKDKSYVTEQTCGSPLRINGPVMAKTLNSWRTAGGIGESSASAAETYNLRADAYLWASAKGDSDGRYLTTYTKELSPRF